MPPRRSPAIHRNAGDAPWQLDDLEPVRLEEVYRYKTLFGTPQHPSPGATMGLLELHPGTYPFHEHPAPEIYYVLRGRASWSVGERTFRVRQGSAIYHAPGVRHRMVNRGKEPLVAVWFWWAPGGTASVLTVPSKLSDSPKRPRQARQER